MKEKFSVRSERTLVDLGFYLSAYGELTVNQESRTRAWSTKFRQTGRS